MGRYLNKIRQHEREYQAEEAKDPPCVSVQGERSERSPVCSDVVIEPAAPNARLIYWERATGIVGPAQPEFLVMVGSGPTASFWVVVQFEGLPIWINSTVLRSQQAFAQQITPKVVDRIREPR